MPFEQLIKDGSIGIKKLFGQFQSVPYNPKANLHIGHGEPCANPDEFNQNAEIGDLYRDLDSDVIYGYGRVISETTAISTSLIDFSAITVISIAAGIATITTFAAHGLIIGDDFTAINTGIANFDDVYEVLTVPSPTQITVATAATGSSITGEIYNWDIGINSGIVIGGSPSDFVTNTGVNLTLSAVGSYMEIQLNTDSSDILGMFSEMTIGPGLGGTSADMKYMVIESSADGFDWQVITTLADFTGLGTVPLSNTLSENQGHNRIRIRNTADTTRNFNTGFYDLKQDISNICLWNAINYEFVIREEIIPGAWEDNNPFPNAGFAFPQAAPVAKNGLYAVIGSIHYLSFSGSGGGGDQVNNSGPVTVQVKSYSAGSYQSISHTSDNFVPGIAGDTFIVNNIILNDTIEINESVAANRKIKFQLYHGDGSTHKINGGQLSLIYIKSL